MCQVIIWLFDHVMQFQTKTHITPLLTIESPAAQWLEWPTISQRVVGSNPIWESPKLSMANKHLNVSNNFLNQIEKQSQHLFAEAKNALNSLCFSCP